MNVTGWTEWGDKNYIDISHENIKNRCETINAFPLPSFEEYMNIPEELREKFLEERKTAMDQALEEYYKNHGDDESVEDEIRAAVISEIKEKGYHFSGDHHQNHPHGAPIIDDVYIYCVSMRDWGGIMADAYPDEDYSDCKDDAFRYCKWAWFNPDLTDQTILP